jgi:hypothetical protein
MPEVTLKNNKGQLGISYSDILSFEDRKGLVLAEARAIETASRVHVKLSAKALKNSAVRGKISRPAADNTNRHWEPKLSTEDYRLN